ncbi:MAG: hypothetical protein L0Y35_02210 [Flammeovirgaceae bacterium]|nr:hypothetical protein [Flammeovirgaceae bacterium]
MNEFKRIQKSEFRATDVYKEFFTAPYFGLIAGENFNDPSPRERGSTAFQIAGYFDGVRPN